MIRPLTVLCLLAACGSGLYLYSEKHRTGLLDREIGRVIRATESARARTGLLSAEWALLNEPGRLQDMAGRYLTLHPMAPTQFVQLANLSAHLPAPLTTPPAEDDDAPGADTPADVAVVTDTGKPASANTAAAPPAVGVSPPADPPATALADKTGSKPTPKQVASATPRQHAQHRIVLADGQDYQLRDGMTARGAPLPLAAPQPVGASVLGASVSGASVYRAMARPMRTGAAHPAVVSAVPSYAPAQPYAPVHAYVPSALGGAGSLPPPVPYGR